MKIARTVLAVVAVALLVACDGIPTASPRGTTPDYSSSGVFIGSGHVSDEGGEAGTTSLSDSTETRSGYGIGSGN